MQAETDEQKERGKISAKHRPQKGFTNVEIEGIVVEERKID